MNLDELVVDTSQEQKPFRVVLYGTDGIGKSTWANCAPNPIFLDLEGGLDFIKTKAIPLREKTLSDFLETLGSLIKQDHEFKTVVVDSIDWLEVKIFDDVVKNYEKSIKSISDIGYAKGYDIALTHWNTILRGFDLLRAKGINIVLLAHAKMLKIEDPMSESYDKWDLKLHKKANPLIREWADCVLFASYEQYLKKTDTGFGSTKNTAIGTGERVIHTQERPAFEAKCRFTMPEKISMDFQEFQSYLKHNQEG